MKSRVHRSEDSDLAYIDLRPWDKADLLPNGISRWYLIKALVYGWNVGLIPGVVAFGIIRREFNETYVWMRWQSRKPVDARLALDVIPIVHSALNTYVERGSRVWLIGNRKNLGFLAHLGFRIEAEQLLNWYEPGDFCGMVLDWDEVPY